MISMGTYVRCTCGAMNVQAWREGRGTRYRCDRCREEWSVQPAPGGKRVVTRHAEGRTA